MNGSYFENKLFVYSGMCIPQRLASRRSGRRFLSGGIRISGARRGGCREDVGRQGGMKKVPAILNF